MGLLLAVATPALAQVPCTRLDTAFACADGTSLAIYDDPWRGSRWRGRGGMQAEGELGRGGDWWKDDQYVHGPRGERCLVHGTHVHCDGTLADGP
jgi:hypothetical protein